MSKHVIVVKGADLRETMELGLALARIIEASGGKAQVTAGEEGRVCLAVECNAVYLRATFEEAAAEAEAEG